MNAHEQFADDLALYALGALEGQERTALEQHLAGCAPCRRELDALRGDGALLAVSATGAAPPQRARQRLMTAIAKEPRLYSRPAQRPRFAWLTSMGWAVAAGMVLAAVLLLRDETVLRGELARLQAEAVQQQGELAKAREVAATLTATDAMRVTLVALKTPPQPQGKAIYQRDRSSLVFLASNMPALPPAKIYELWLIPVQGNPIPAGLFKPDAHGSATVIQPPLPAGVEAKAFAITVEPEAGSAAPTSTPIMVGAGE
jgi:anti-sigma-K factor RskA